MSYSSQQKFGEKDIQFQFFGEVFEFDFPEPTKRGRFERRDFTYMLYAKRGDKKYRVDLFGNVKVLLIEDRKDKEIPV